LHHAGTQSLKSKPQFVFLAGGVAAACGKIQVGDVVVAVGRTGVSGLKSAMLRDLIMGSPGTACDLVLSR